LLSDTLRRELARYALGPKIRALRLQRNLRLADVAIRSNLSPSMLSKIERSQSVPSLAALQAIAVALEVTLPFFFPKPRRPRPAVTRPAERIVLPEFSRSKESSFDFESLNFSATEPRLHCYRAHFRHPSKPRPHAHPGSEFLFVLTGTLQVAIADETHVLEEGDSMYFESHLPHSYAKTGNQPCSAIVVTLPALPSVADLDLQGSGETLRLRDHQIIWRRAV
jgi:transcriptional regulator with XRE-family HTH domain